MMFAFIFILHKPCEKFKLFCIDIYMHYKKKGFAWPAMLLCNRGTDRYNSRLSSLIVTMIHFITDYHIFPPKHSHFCHKFVWLQMSRFFVKIRLSLDLINCIFSGEKLTNVSILSVCISVVRNRLRPVACRYACQQFRQCNCYTLYK